MRRDILESIKQIQILMRSDGTLLIIKRIFLRVLYLVLPKKLVKIMILSGDVESRFAKIHRFNYWSNLETSSGGGSTTKVTSNVRAELPVLIEAHSISSICDAPCGEYTWMKSVIENTGIRYTGVDIVTQLVDKNLASASNGEKFVKADIRSFSFNGFDLVLVRDLLFHFSYEDINNFLENLAECDYQFLLTTSYEQDGTFINRDIKTGDFRRINLFSEPFHFENSYLSSIEDWQAPEAKRYLYLWSKNQVPDRLFKS